MKALRPVVDKVNEVYPQIQSLSNDELRAKTEEIKAQLQEAVKPYREEIEKLNAKIQETEIEKGNLYSMK